jgi:putative spermidine/putrescine transport system ATP-binding protein
MTEELDLHSAPCVGSETLQRSACMSLRSTSEAATSAVSFRGVERHFGAVKAVDGVDLDIRPGEFFAMLGPSGSGKTTCLRLIGGFDQPTAGRIEIFGEAVEGVPVYRRPVNTVFQDYALFPHMNVLENVCYGLMISGAWTEPSVVASASRRSSSSSSWGWRRASSASFPADSGTGRSCARSVLRPKVLLLDEPLGALDLAARGDAGRARSSAFARPYLCLVTHDQGEALDGRSSRGFQSW